MMVNMFDKDLSGQITFDEFVQLMYNMGNLSEISEEQEEKEKERQPSRSLNSVRASEYFVENHSKKKDERGTMMKMMKDKPMKMMKDKPMREGRWGSVVGERFSFLAKTIVKREEGKREEKIGAKEIEKLTKRLKQTASERASEKERERERERERESNEDD